MRFNVGDVVRVRAQLTSDSVGIPPHLLELYKAKPQVVQTIAHNRIMLSHIPYVWVESNLEHAFQLNLLEQIRMKIRRGLKLEVANEESTKDSKVKD